MKLPTNKDVRVQILCSLLLLLVSAWPAAAAENWYRTDFRKLHLDYHLNPWIHDAAAAVTLDEARRQMRMMKEAGVESVEFFAYDHFGNAFYPSDVMPRHPTLRQDYFGNMRQAARENGVHAVAYVNVSGNRYLFSTHPDWYIVDKTGTKYAAASWLPVDKSQICASSPFLEQVYKPFLKELISRYSPDAIWLDGGSWLVETPCYCPFCRTKYRAVSGEEIPDPPQRGAGRTRETDEMSKDSKTGYTLTRLERLRIACAGLSSFPATSPAFVPITAQIMHFRAISLLDSCQLGLDGCIFLVNGMFFAGHFVIVAFVFMYIAGSIFIFNISKAQPPVRTRKSMREFMRPAYSSGSSPQAVKAPFCAWQ